MTKSTKFLLLLTVFGMAALVLIGTGTAGLLDGSKGKESNASGASKFFALPVGSIVEAAEELKGEKEGRINALFLGIGGEEHPGELLTDTIMLASFSPVKNRTDIFSVPRDLVVRLADQNKFVKINSLYVLGAGPLFPKPGGVELLANKIKEITGLEVAYYFIIDFQALTRAVDIVGGISVPQENNISDPLFPTDDRGYEEFNVTKGWRYLSGEEALKYVRTRHSGQGDFDRMRRQHRVLTALKNKVAQLGLKDLSTIAELYGIVREHVATNASLGETQRLMQLTNSLAEDTALFHVISSEPGGLLVSSPMTLGGVEASALLPQAGMENYTEIVKYIKDTINQ